MDKPDNELSDKQKQFVEFLEKASNQDKEPPDDQLRNEIQEEVKEEEKKEEKKEVIHLNSLITKNISLFTKNPNYKLLAWLIVQLTILSLFILTASFLKNNLVPYINSLWIDRYRINEILNINDIYLRKGHILDIKFLLIN